MTEPRRGMYRHIAAAMVDTINGDDVLSQLVRAEQVADPKKRLEQIDVGQFVVDVIGRGARRSNMNREDDDPVIIVAVAVHCRLLNGQVTNAVLDEASYISEQVDDFLNDLEELALPTPLEPAILIESEPFPLSREALFGHGLFLQTMQYSWQAIQ